MKNYTLSTPRVLLAATYLFVMALSIGAINAGADDSVKANVDRLVKTNECVSCDLHGADLNRLTLRGADLRDANLVGAMFHLADLSGADLRNADLRDARFGGADLADADLRGANTSGTVFAGAYLVGTKMESSPAAPSETAALQPEISTGQTAPKESTEGTVESGSMSEPARQQEASQKTAQTEEVRVPLSESPNMAVQTGGSDAPPQKFIEPPAPVAIETTPQEQPIPEPVEVPAEGSRDKTGEVTEGGHNPPAQSEVKVEVAGERNEAVPMPGSQNEAEGGEAKSLGGTVEQLLDSGKCYGCNFAGSDLSGKSLRKADLESADFSGAILDGVNFSGANLKNASFRQARLKNADFSDADLYKADFSGADLTGADFDGAMTDEANFSGATGRQ